MTGKPDDLLVDLGKFRVKLRWKFLKMGNFQKKLFWK